MSRKTTPSERGAIVLRGQRDFALGLAYTAVLSGFINILQLTVPLFMLQVHDRVVNSRSTDTLTMLVILAIGALTLYAVLEFIRSLTFQIMAGSFARRLNLPALEAAVSASIEEGSPRASQAIRDLNDVRAFIGGNAVATPLEAAWSPIFLGVLFALHPLYGIVGFVSILVLVALGIISDRLTRSVLREANDAAVDNINEVGTTLRHAEAIDAMGMLPALGRRWRVSQTNMLERLELGTSRAKALSATTRSCRLMMQISVLSVGATLTIDGQVTPGAMVAGSILLGRLLFPFDHMVNDWRQWISAGSAWKRVRTLLESERSARQTMPHAQTEGDLVVDRIIYAPSGSERTIMKGVSFSLSPGEILGVIGPSGAGKSTLARLLVGVLKPNSGGVYIDGHNVYLWERGSFGAMVGYVPQSVSLLDGTIAENIARMNEPDARRVVEAARLAGVHELIGRLPLGYDTPVKEGDFKLSGGQKQRVALARALYGQPRLLVLDEPNANLDNEGEQALLRAIAAARDSGAIVVMIAHRPSIMQIADKLLVLQEGRVSQFGPRTSVVGVVTPSGAVPAKAQDHKRLRDGTRGQPA